MAGPESPPVTFSSMGKRVLISIAMPSKVLIIDKASAPPFTAAFAITTISVTLGESFTIRGEEVTFLTFLTSSSVILGSVPKVIPPFSTFGQEMFISRAAISVMSFNLSAARTYSS